MGRPRSTLPPPTDTPTQDERPTSAIEQLQATPEQTGAVAAALVLGSIPLVAQAVLTAQAAELTIAGAQQSALVAAHVARLGLTAPVLPPAPQQPQRVARITVTRTVTRQRRDVATTRVQRAGYVRELLNRARYVRAAFTRGARAYREGDQAAQAWRNHERVWHALHVEAMRSRQEARARVDQAAARYGTILGWNGIRDASTTRDCLEMFGKNFDATRPPARGLPGTVHGKCRCVPVAPYPGAEVVF
jgi:hypothetical protein